MKFMCEMNENKIWPKMIQKVTVIRKGWAESDFVCYRYLW